MVYVDIANFIIMLIMGIKYILLSLSYLKISFYKDFIKDN